MRLVEIIRFIKLYAKSTKRCTVKHIRVLIRDRLRRVNKTDKLCWVRWRGIVADAIGDVETAIHIMYSQCAPDMSAGRRRVGGRVRKCRQVFCTDSFFRLRQTCLPSLKADTKTRPVPAMF